MSGVTGREVVMAFAKFGTNSWGVAASVTKGIYFSSDGGLKYQPDIIEDDAFGQTFIKQSDVGNVQAPAVSWPARARFDDYTYILNALAMGSPAAVSISTSAVGQVTSWLHQFDLSANIDGLGATFAMDKQRYVEELTSAKVHGFDLEDGQGGLMQMTFRILGSKPTNISSVNINSTVGGATFPSLANRVLKRQGTFRMNLNAAGALGAGDAVAAESIKFSFVRPQDAPFVYGQDFVAEPADNGFPNFSLEVQYPRMTQTSANSLYGALMNATGFKADWTFLGAYINSTDQYKVLFQFPYLNITNFEALTVGANQIKPKATFLARLAATSPTGMAFVNPFRMSRIMINSTVAF
jgi:hypothetical protein